MTLSNNLSMFSLDENEQVDIKIVGVNGNYDLFSSGFLFTISSDGFG